MYQEGWGGYSQTLKLILCLYDVSDTVLNIYVVSPTPAPFSRNTIIIPPPHLYEETEALRSSHSLHYLSVISTGQVNYFCVCMCNVQCMMCADVCACSHVCACGYTCALAGTWRSEDSLGCYLVCDKVSVSCSCVNSGYLACELWGFSCLRILSGHRKPGTLDVCC